MADDAPISPADSRALLSALDDVIAANRVRENPTPSPAGEAMPEGFSTKSLATVRRPNTSVEPATPIDAAWEQAQPAAPDAPIAPKATEPVPTIGEPVSAGRDLNAPGRIPVDAPKITANVPRGTEPSGMVTTPDGAVSVGVESRIPDVGAAAPGEPGYVGPKALYGRLSDDALQAEYRALTDKRAALQEQAQAPVWTEERNDAWVGAAENRRRGNTLDKIGNRDSNRTELLGEPVHTFESQAAEQQVNAIAKHLDAIEREFGTRGIDKAQALQPVGPVPESPVPSTRGYPAEWDLSPDGPNAKAAPREYLNYAKFGLDRTTEARLRDTVEGLRVFGEVDKNYQSFEQQRAVAKAFADDFLQNPLDKDPAKMGKLSGAEIVGLRRVAAENTKMIEGLSQAIESGDLSVEDTAHANTLLDHAVQSTNEVLGKIVRETAQTGRDLGFLRQVAKLTTDPDVWIVRAKKLLGDQPMTDGMMVEIRKLAREASEACG
jgi:hypothetical protein